MTCKQRKFKLKIGNSYLHNNLKITCTTDIKFVQNGSGPDNMFWGIGNNDVLSDIDDFSFDCSDDTNFGPEWRWQIVDERVDCHCHLSSNRGRRVFLYARSVGGKGVVQRRPPRIVVLSKYEVQIYTLPSPRNNQNRNYSIL